MYVYKNNLNKKMQFTHSSFPDWLTNFKVSEKKNSLGPDLSSISPHAFLAFGLSKRTILKIEELERSCWSTLHHWDNSPLFAT